MSRRVEDLKPYTRINRRGRVAALSALELEKPMAKSAGSTGGRSQDL